MSENTEVMRCSGNAADRLLSWAWGLGSSNTLTPVGRKLGGRGV